MFELLNSLGKASSVEGGWRELTTTNTPAPRTEMTMATYGRNIYMYGGALSDGTLTDEMWRLNVDTNAWTKMKSSTFPVRLHRMVATNKKIYSYGGLLANDTYTPIVRVYDIATDAWSTIAAPTAGIIGKANVGIVSIGTAIYFLGGVDSDQPAGYTGFLKLETYPTAAWSTLTAHPVPIANGNLAVYDDYIFSSHGTSNNGATVNDKVRAYDIYANTTGWVEKATIPTTNATARNSGTAVTKGEEIWYFGGSGQSDVIEVYNAYTNTYNAQGTNKMKADKQSARAWTAGNKQYFFGGVDSKVWEFDSNFGKPKPGFVLVPHQEFITGIDYASTVGSVYVPGVGTNWCLVRPLNGETWIYPQKFIRSGVKYRDYPWYGATFQGQNWAYVTPDPVANTVGAWDNINACLTAGKSIGQPNVWPRVANFRNVTMWPVAAYVLTTVDNGDTSPVRGGTDYAGNSSQGQLVAQNYLKPILRLTSGTVPW